MDDRLNILNSVDNKLLENGIASVSDRYYEHKYCMKIGNIDDLHQRISFHSNRICMLSLAENHPVMKEGKSVKRLNCVIDSKTDRLKNAATGKGKRGAQKLVPESVICYIECDDGSTYPVYSCIKGKLIAINDNVVKDPNLLLKKPVSDGHIALLLPILNIFTECKNSMLTPEQYHGLEKN